MRVLILVDHYPLSPRVTKIKNTYNKKGFTTRIVSWDRRLDSSLAIETDVDLFKQQLGYGNRMQKLLNLKLLRKAVESTINLYLPDIVHAVDFEMAWIATSLKTKTIRDFKIIYEVYDIKFFNNKFLNRIRIKIENIILDKVNLIIFASPYFPKYYKRVFSFTRNYMVLNNKPSISQVDIDNFIYNKNNEDINKKLSISFVGTVRYFETLKNLINATRDIDSVRVDIYGDGPDFEKINKIKHDNVYLHGAFSVTDLPEIYSKIDIVWACYPPDNENVKYAVSNKFFESLYFSKPILVTDGTYLGNKVEEEHLGKAINPESEKCIIDTINNIKNYHFSLLKPLNPKYTWENDEEIFLDFLEKLI